MRSILLDTNILLLLIVGTYGRQLIGQHKRTKIFTPEDYDLLVKHIEPYQRWWVTSHSLGEVSNLLRQTRTQQQAKALMACFATLCNGLKESHIGKDRLFQDALYMRLGITDTGIMLKAKRVNCVLTVDLDLHNEILKRGYKSENFNHLRSKHLLT